VIILVGALMLVLDDALTLLGLVVGYCAFHSVVCHRLPNLGYIALEICSPSSSGPVLISELPDLIVVG